MIFPRAVAAPLILYFLLSILYLVAIPTGESPDEPGHLQCIEQVSGLRRLPRYAQPPPGEWWQQQTVVSDHICYHMPLYYIVGGLTQIAISSTIGGTLDYQFPPTNPDGPTPSMFLHPDTGLSANLSAPITITGVRILTILVGAVIVIVTYRFTLKLFPQNENAAVTAALLLAGWPQFLFMSRAINNDILTAALSLAVLTILIEVGKPRRYVWVGLLTALSILTKITAAYILVAVLITFSLEVWINKVNRKHYVKPGLVLGGIIVGLILLFLLQPTVRDNFLLSSKSFGRLAERAISATYWKDVIIYSLRSGVAYFGWMNITASDLLITGWWIFIFLGLTVGVWSGVRESSVPFNKLKWAIVLIWVAGSLATYLRINMNRFQPQVRFILVLLPLLSSTASYGYHVLLHRFPNINQRMNVVLGVALIGLNIWLVFTIIQPAYSQIP